MSAALAEKIIAVMDDGAGHSPRGVHRILKGRFSAIQNSLVDLEAQGVVTVEERPGNRRLYTLVPRSELTAIRRSRRLLAAVREAGTLVRSDAYRPAGATTAGQLDVVIDRLVAEGLVVEGEDRRLMAPANDAALSPDAVRLLEAIRAENPARSKWAVDGLSLSDCDTVLEGADARPLLGALVLAGHLVAHESEGWPWWVATEFSEPDPSPESPDWGLADKSAMVCRQVIALGPKTEAVLMAAGRRQGLDMRPGDVQRVALDIGLREVNGAWRDDPRCSDGQRLMRRIVLNGGQEPPSQMTGAA